jgi:hypothetical protein
VRVVRQRGQHRIEDGAFVVVVDGLEVGSHGSRLAAPGWGARASTVGRPALSWEPIA